MKIKTLKKKIKPSIKVEDAAKTRSDEAWDEYLDIYSRRMCPSNGAHRERLCIALIEWAANHPRATKIKQFLQLKGIGIQTWYDWCKKYDYVKKANNDALMILGNRREEMLNLDLKSEKSLIYMMPHYDDDWSQREKVVADLKVKDEALPSKIEVVMQSYSDEVKAPELTNGDE